MLPLILDDFLDCASFRDLTVAKLFLRFALSAGKGIEWDDDRGGRVPLLVIDGREINWDEFGRMLMSFEGSQFKLSIADKSDEL